MNSYVIETHGLTKTYGEVNSVSNLSIHVKKGRIYGLLGRNGAGKTTTMRMLLGLTAPSSGEIKIWGRPLRGSEKKILPRVGSLIESPGFYPNLTGTENLRIFADLRGLKGPRFIKDALEVVNLPYWDKKLFSQYSLGMKQRLAIALAVMHNPELLILDEPINGLDPIGIAEMRGFIRELCDSTGKTILISSHILSEVQAVCQTILIISKGKLVACDSPENLERLFAGTATVNLVVEAQEKNIRGILQDISGLVKIHTKPMEDGCCQVQVELEGHDDRKACRDLFFAFSRANSPILQMSAAKASLEDIFLELTQEEKEESAK